MDKFGYKLYILWYSNGIVLVFGERVLRKVGEIWPRTPPPPSRSATICREEKNERFPVNRTCRSLPGERVSLDRL